MGNTKLISWMILAFALTGCTQTYPGGLTKQEWDSLPPERRAQLQLQQDQIDQQRRANENTETIIQQQQQAPPAAPPPHAQYVPRQGWTFLGRSDVDYHTDHVVFQVGKSYGLFRAVHFSVRGGDIDLDKVVVVFGNGERVTPDLRGHYDENTTSRAIEFPGDVRYIDRVEFTYRKADRRERHPTVSLFAGR